MSGQQKNRPSPAQIASRRLEIARRYRKKRHRKGISRPQLAAIRIAELNMIIAKRFPHGLQEDDTGKRFATIVGHHLIRLAGHPQQRLLAWGSLYARWLDIDQIEELLTTIAVHPKTWKADTLAWQIGLTMLERTDLRITTIGAIDCNAKQRATLRRAKSKQRSKRYRNAKRRHANAP